MEIDSDTILKALRELDPTTVELVTLRLLTAKQEEEIEALRGQLATYEATALTRPATTSTNAPWTVHHDAE